MLCGCDQLAWLHTRPTHLTYVFVSANPAFDVQLLRGFEKLFVCDGVRFGNFADAFMLLHRQHKPMFEKDFLHAHVLWSVLTWVELSVLHNELESGL